MAEAFATAGLARGAIYDAILGHCDLTAFVFGSISIVRHG
jgi:hypothetical protein